MRVSNSMIAHSSILRIGQSTAKSYELQEQISSGRRIMRPSDDPPSAIYASALRSALAEVSQYKSNANDARSLLQITDSSLGNVADLLRSARQYALAGVNGTSDTATRAALAQSVDQVMQALVNDANGDRAGFYIFGGYRATSSPFTLNGGGPPPVIYNGDSGIISFEISRGTIVEVNLPGDRVFNMNGQADPAISDVFTTLATLRDALSSGNDAQAQICIGELDDHVARINSLRAQTGVKAQAVELLSNRLTTHELSLSQSLSNVEDVDIAKALVDLQTQQNIYQATVSVASMLSQLGLVDYLR